MDPATISAEQKEQIVASAKIKLATKAQALKRLLSDDKHSNKRQSSSALRRILRVDCELHKIFLVCNYPSDLTLNQFMAQEVQFADYDNKIMAIKNDLDVFDLLEDSDLDSNSNQPPRKRRKKNKNVKHRIKSKDIVDLNIEQEYDVCPIYACVPPFYFVLGIPFSYGILIKK